MGADLAIRFGAGTGGDWEFTTQNTSQSAAMADHA